MDMQPHWEKVLRAVNNGQQPTAADWEALTADEQDLINMLQREKLTDRSLEFLDKIDDQKAWLKLSANVEQPAIGKSVRMRFLRYAAVIGGLLLMGAATLFLLQKNEPLKPTTADSGKYVTEPVNQKRATLVLADGRSIELNKNPDSKISQDQTEINNIDTSLLKYTVAANTLKPAGYNTLIIPRGGKYRVELADGSEIWLNAESKLRYPAHFGGVKKREVFLEAGEAYFKVKKNADMPFVVKANGMDVQVLGTEFNVNTYTPQYATTLAHGSVKLSAGNTETILAPGQQAVLTGGNFKKSSVDVYTYTGWKDGQIIFEETTLEEVMNSLGRQYDFTFQFTSPQVKDRKFGGRLSRTDQIEDVLTIIEKTGNLKFNIQGKTILVSSTIAR